MKNFERPSEAENQVPKEEVAIGELPGFVIQDEILVPRGENFKWLADKMRKDFKFSQKEAEAMATYLPDLNLLPEQLIGRKKVLDVGSAEGFFKDALEKI